MQSLAFFVLHPKQRLLDRSVGALFRCAGLYVAADGSILHREWLANRRAVGESASESQRISRSGSVSQADTSDTYHTRWRRSLPRTQHGNTAEANAERCGHS